MTGLAAVPYTELPHFKIKIDNIIYFTDNIYMLDYLVKSALRRKILKTLWTNQREGNIHELAQLVGVPYSHMYNELKEMYMAGLAHRHRSGNSLIYSANQHYSHAQLLRQLLTLDSLEKPGEPKEHSVQHPEAQNILSHLQYFETPLTGEFSLSTSLTIEETIVKSLELARWYPPIARVLPVVIHRNRKKIDLNLLVMLANKNSQKKALGFFLELTAILSGDHNLKSIAKKCRDRRYKRHEYFFYRQGKNKYFQRLTQKKTPTVAKKWHFLMNIELETFKSVYRKFAA